MSLRQSSCPPRTGAFLSLLCAALLVSAPATLVAQPGGEGGADPDTEIWDRYDFVPGERVLYATDVSDVAVGSFPTRLEFGGGRLEVVERDGERWLRATDHSRFRVPLETKLPERFTIEFEVYDPANWTGVNVLTSPPEGGMGAYEASYFNVGHRNGSGVHTPEDVGPSSMTEIDTRDRVATARIMVDGSYAKMYVDSVRVANIPNAHLERSDGVTFLIWRATPESPILLRGIRIAEGGGRLYDDLSEEGEAVTRGILFDVDSATIRPESRPVLEEIARVLNDHPELGLRIEGHTDARGDAEYNESLSRRRAEAVRDRLIDAYGIDPGRLEAVGLGESEPIATNETPEGRQNNRRVELVRIEE